ncbi:MAG: insulinase family protein [Acidobacteriota bacterium]|nr:insulinase family protein [Acidobacteriota bacterium]
MKLKNSLLEIRFFCAFVLLVLTTAGGLTVAYAQTAREPRKEQILNGLKVFLFSDPKADKIIVKLRIHAGSAFDPVQRAGTMRLLGDILFPDEETKRFFEEDLGGSLNVTTNYDFIEITATGNDEEFERILDAVRNAVIAPPITPENFKKVRDARLREAQEESKNVAVVADLAVRRRLYGSFPYGRAAGGTPESLAKIEIGDLIVARDRFFNADYASLLIIGNVKESYALRAARQLFGSWKKADKPLVSTFRQPDAPDSKILIVDAPDAPNAEIRIAVRGLAQNDKDSFAAAVFAKLLERKLQNELGALQVEHNAHVLPGELIIRASVPTEKAAQTLNALRAAINRSVSEKADAKAFSETQSEILNSLQTESAKPEKALQSWLDAETFKMSASNERLSAIKSVTPSDAERIAARFFKDAPQAIVIVGDADKIQPQIDGLGGKK